MKDPIIIGKATLYNVDCMTYMATLPDKAFDLAIVDPPYGLPADSMNGRGKMLDRAIFMDTSWDVAPNAAYFEELRRISLNQIIWGGNYFILPPTRGIIAWDKVQPWPSFSAWEMAWTSFNEVARLFKFDNRTGDKIHPTQKPVKLYEWLLTNYAKPGQRILDTHLGSGSHAIACNNLGFELTACELDKDYFDASCKRIEQATAQHRLFA
ncbi:MAG TPA: DNA methyltransferase [Gallionella sp.]|nr:DNA methyltransferase [Gallionella sp.]